MEPNVHYHMLELEPGASPDEIRQAYRDLVTVWHPDRFFDNPRLQQKAQEKLKRINVAYAYLKSHPSQVVESQGHPRQAQPVEPLIHCGKLEHLLKLSQWKAADQETQRLLLELASREKEGWLRTEDLKTLSPPALAAIDRLWTQYSQGRFGLSVQRQVWYNLHCTSSKTPALQIMNENKFGQAVGWRAGSLWLSPWDAFDYRLQAPQGSLPRAYIFTLSGWWS